MKKKILAICLVICMAVVAVAGASLAYFTDTDRKTNVFTSGKVDITLNENFIQGSQLIPGASVTKDVTVTLEAGSIPTYVWYTYSVPVALDNGILHVNHAGRNWLGHQNNQSYWEAGQTAATPENKCWIVDYQLEEGVMVNGVSCNVYTVLYNGVLSAGESTTVGMSKVFIDPAVDYNNALGVYTVGGSPIGFDLNDVEIVVTAYGIQAATFANVYDAYEAYHTQGAAEYSIDID